MFYCIYAFIAYAHAYIYMYICVYSNMWNYKMYEILFY